MKSPLQKYRIKSQFNDSLQINSTRRFSTQPNSSNMTYIYQPHSLKNSRKKNSIIRMFKQDIQISQSKSLNKNEIVHIEKTNKYIPDTYIYQAEIKNGKSNKSYNEVVGYGWAHLNNKKTKRQAQFNINLGKINTFMIVDFKGSSKSSKQICLEFSIRMLKVVESFKNTKINENTIIQVNQITFEEFSILGELSLMTIVITESKIIVVKIGKLNCLIFTKNNQLKKFQHKNEAKKTKNFQRFSKIIQRSKTHRQKSQMIQLYQKNSSDILPKISIECFNIDQILWIAAYNQLATFSYQKQIIKNNINKQLSLNSSQYCYGQVGMQACTKILNDYSRYRQQCLMMVIFTSTYPFQKQKQIKQVRQVKNLYCKFKTIYHQNQCQVENNKPRLLRYMGNRSSFIKNNKQIPSSQRKNQKIIRKM